MTETTYYKLKKPDENDNVYVSDLNGNADIIDKTLHDLSEKGTPIIDVGQQTSGRPFSITAEQMQALLSDPAPEVHVSMSGMVITLRRYDMTSNVAYYSNVMYSQGVKHFISMQAMGTSATITDAEEIQIPTPSGAGDKDKILQANANGGFDLKPPTVLPFLPLAGGTMTGQMGVLAPSKDNAPLRRIDGLSNATASSLGLAAGSVPDKAFAKLKTLVDAAQSTGNSKSQIIIGSYMATGSAAKIQFPTKPKLWGIYYVESNGKPAYSLSNISPWFDDGSYSLLMGTANSNDYIIITTISVLFSGTSVTISDRLIQNGFKVYYFAIL